MCAQTDWEKQSERTRPGAHKEVVRNQWVTAQFKRSLCIMTAVTLWLPSAHLISRLRSCLETNCGVSSYLCARSMADVRAPRAGRQYRVARAGGTEYRRVTDRYHNHTSPLIASTCWIKHSAFLPRAVTPSKLIQVHFTHSEKIEKERWNGKIHWKNGVWTTFLLRNCKFHKHLQRNGK